MLSNAELFEKCKTGSSITCDDLGINPNLKNCATTIECGFKTFYSDGVNFFDVKGNLISEKEVEEYIT